MKVGIIGCGMIAKVHAPIIQREPDAEIVGVADHDLGRANALSRSLDQVPVFDDAERMIDETQPEVVHVLVPPEFHAELSIMAMRKGCHVLVEKPMALTTGEAEAMVAAAKNNRVRLCVVHSKVFDDTPRRALALVSQGAIGDVVSVEAHYIYDPRRSPAVLEEGAEHSHWSFRLNGGLLQDLLVHPASLVCELMPRIDEVHAIGLNIGRMPEGWQDEIRVLIKGGSVRGRLTVSLNEGPDAITFTIRGREGVIRADLFNNTLVVQKRSRLPRAVVRALSGFQLAAQHFRGAVRNVLRFALGRIDPSGGIEPVISKLYAAIRTGDDSPVSLESSLHVVELMTRLWPSVPRRAEFRAVDGMSKSTTTVLVTGASGFIGTHLVKKLLAEGFGVRALVRPNSIHSGRLHSFDVEVVEGDAADPNVLHKVTKGVDSIYHAASCMNNDWDEQARVTIGGTELLLEAALAHGVDRFVHLSSLAVYDAAQASKKSPIREDSPLRQKPRKMGAYAHAKIRTEQMVLEALRDHGLEATIVRPGVVIGPLGRLFFPQLGYRYKDALFVIIGSGRNVLPLIYVEDAVDAIYRAGTTDQAIGQTYNVVDDATVTVSEYLQRYIDATGATPRLVHIPYVFAYTATAGYELAAAVKLVKPGVTSRSQLKWKQSSVRYDSSKVKLELEWAPMVGVDEGLARTFEWHQTRR